MKKSMATPETSGIRHAAGGLEWTNNLAERAVKPFVTESLCHDLKNSQVTVDNIHPCLTQSMDFVRQGFFG